MFFRGLFAHAPSVVKAERIPALRKVEEASSAIRIDCFLLFYPLDIRVFSRSLICKYHASFSLNIGLKIFIAQRLRADYFNNNSNVKLIRINS